MTDRETLLKDIKQLLDARISQSEKRLEDVFDRKIDELRQDMNDGFASIADVITTLNDRDDELGIRVTKLEKQSA